MLAAEGFDRRTRLWWRESRNRPALPSIVRQSFTNQSATGNRFVEPRHGRRRM